MTCHRICDQQRQPCPSAWLCEMGCNFTNAELPATKLNTTNSDHSNPGYPFWLLDKPGNAWDRCNWWQKWLVACAIVAVFAHLAGYGK
jgi:hypothetical protein